jgi:dihydropteroate synthase
MSDLARTPQPSARRVGDALSDSPIAGVTSAIRAPVPPTTIGPEAFAWGTRTFVMGIVNVTPDSFSGDGLLDATGPETHSPTDRVRAAVALGRAMVDEGADLLDVGGESTRPGHEPVPTADEMARVVPVVEALRAALPNVPISVDTTKAAVAAAALDAGASLLNDVWGVSTDDAMRRLAAERQVPIVLMHNRAEARYADVVAEVVADLRAAIERATDLGVPDASIILDPGIGFGKTAEHNVTLLRRLAALHVLGRPVLLGTSRKSTLGRILGLPPTERVEATVATTALGIAAGVDVIRVHDVQANVRAARVADAIVRAVPLPPDQSSGGPR